MIASPMRFLTSYAIAFATGAAAVVGLYAYGQWMRARGRCEVRKLMDVCITPRAGWTATDAFLGAGGDHRSMWCPRTESAHEAERLFKSPAIQ